MKLPDRTRTVPSGRVVAVGYQRRTSSCAGVLIGAVGVQVFVVALYRQAWLSPSPSARCPPTTRSRPSGRKVWPEQKRLTLVLLARRGCGVFTVVPLFGSQTNGVHSWTSNESAGRSRRPHISTRLFGSTLA
jgi:hypothetical protein